MDCHFLLQGIFLTQGSNLSLLNCRWILYHLSHQGSPPKVNNLVLCYAEGGFLQTLGLTARGFSSSVRKRECLGSSFAWRHGRGQELPGCQVPLLGSLWSMLLSTRPHKDSTCNAVDTGELGSIPGSGRSPGGGTWKPTPVFLPEKSHGQKSLVGYGPKGLKESDVTKQLSTHRETEPTPVTGSVIPPLWLPSLPVFLPHAPVSISWDYFPNKLFTPSILSLISAFRETQIKTLPREMKGTKLCYENVYLNKLNKVSL